MHPGNTYNKLWQILFVVVAILRGLLFRGVVV